MTGTDPAAPLLCAIHEGTARLVLNRPGSGNALSLPLIEALIARLGALAADPAVHTLVIEGAGRHLCTGFDLASLEAETDATLLHRMVRIEQMLDMLWRAPLRTFALGRGRITGAGADLFAACDHRLIAPDATLQFPGVRFGLVLGTRRLGARVGADRALRILAGGERVTAEAALETGLATAPLAPSGLPDPAPPVVTRETFAALRRALDDGGADRDLAALVRSAARPGLRDRIESYVASLRAERQG